MSSLIIIIVLSGIVSAFIYNFINKQHFLESFKCSLNHCVYMDMHILGHDIKCIPYCEMRLNKSLKNFLKAFSFKHGFYATKVILYPSILKDYGKGS